MARFFAVSGSALEEDPATGSAAVNLGGWLALTGRRDERITISQGDQVARPSRLVVSIDGAGTVFVGLCGIGPWLSHFAFELKHYAGDATWALLLPVAAAWALEGGTTAARATRLAAWTGLAVVGQWLANGATFVLPACLLVLVAGAWRRRRELRFRNQERRERVRHEAEQVDTGGGLHLQRSERPRALRERRCDAREEQRGREDDAAQGRGGGRLSSDGEHLEDRNRLGETFENSATEWHGFYLVAHVRERGLGDERLTAGGR